MAEFDELAADALDYDLILFNNCRPKTLPPAGSFVFVNEWPDDVPARHARNTDAAGAGTGRTASTPSCGTSASAPFGSPGHVRST